MPVVADVVVFVVDVIVILVNGSILHCSRGYHYRLHHRYPHQQPSLTSHLCPVRDGMWYERCYVI